MTLTAGFYGKIPSRGDFVGSGLPRAMVDRLDDWWQHVLTGSKNLLGPGWTALWMDAPIWRFTFAAGLCGPGFVAGIWMPSTDKAGRLFPLTFAATGPDAGRCGQFLDAAEQAGLNALELDSDPEAITAALLPATHLLDTPVPSPRPGHTLWWTQGSPNVGATRREEVGLPDSPAFAAMLTDRSPHQRISPGARPTSS